MINALNDVAVLAPNDVWAVGGDIRNFNAQASEALLMHNVAATVTIANKAIGDAHTMFRLGPSTATIVATPSNPVQIAHTARPRERARWFTRSLSAQPRRR